ncbi:MAG: UDP-2,4-diacetamido-2,4,6-trideoxy-beta-L-altropyranose hydrolase [Terriglobales bacterium]
MNQAEPLLIRADADLRMGTGHVMRCLALAQAWQDVAGQAEFLTTSDTPDILSRLRAEGMQVTPATLPAGSAADAAHTASRAREIGASWVVVDGYQFDAAYQQALKSAGLKVLWVDDYGHAPPYCADLVLNQNLCAEESFYLSREASTRLLLGACYALLRREFQSWRDWRRDLPQRAAKVVVTMGGSDCANTTHKVLESLHSVNVPGLGARLVVGPANPFRETLEAAAAASGCNVHVVTAGRDMPQLMAWADVAVAAAGSTCWELMFMGLPSLLVIQTEHQQRVAETLHDRGMALNLGRAESLLPGNVAQALVNLLGSRSVREQMSQRGRQLLDGKGAERVIAAMDAST